MTHSTNDVLLGLGSNVGDRIGFLSQAVRRLKATPSFTILKASSVYETEPVGVKDQPEFLNAALRIRTSMSIAELHSLVKSIEKEIGRQEQVRWGPREIDIDILLFGGLVLSDGAITVPHREMNNRKFVLQSLAEVAPEIVHPISKKSMKQLFDECTDTNAVTVSPQMSELFLKTVEE